MWNSSIFNIHWIAFAVHRMWWIPICNWPSLVQFDKKESSLLMLLIIIEKLLVMHHKFIRVTPEEDSVFLWGLACACFQVGLVIRFCCKKMRCQIAPWLWTLGVDLAASRSAESLIARECCLFMRAFFLIIRLPFLESFSLSINSDVRPRVNELSSRATDICKCHFVFVQKQSGLRALRLGHLILLTL